MESVRRPSRATKQGAISRRDALVRDRLALHEGFGQAGESARADQSHLAMAGEFPDQVAGIVARHRAGRGQHRDQPRLRHFGRRLDRGHRADEGNLRPARAQDRQHQGRGGVAGDDHAIGRMVRDQALHRGQHQGRDLVFAFRAIGKAEVVGGIDIIGVGPLGGERAKHGQPAEAGIEHEDFRRAGHGSGGCGGRSGEWNALSVNKALAC